MTWEHLISLVYLNVNSQNLLRREAAALLTEQKQKVDWLHWFKINLKKNAETTYRTYKKKRLDKDSGINVAWVSQK